MALLPWNVLSLTVSALSTSLSMAPPTAVGPGPAALEPETARLPWKVLWLTIRVPLKRLKMAPPNAVPTKAESPVGAPVLSLPSPPRARLFVSVQPVMVIVAPNPLKIAPPLAWPKEWTPSAPSPAWDTLPDRTQSVRVIVPPRTLLIAAAEVLAPCEPRSRLPMKVLSVIVVVPSWTSRAPPSLKPGLVIWLPVKADPVTLTDPWKAKRAPPEANRLPEAELPVKVESRTTSVVPTSLSMAPPSPRLLVPSMAWLAVNAQESTVREALFWQSMAPPCPPVPTTRPKAPPAATLPVNVLPVMVALPRSKMPPPKPNPGPPTAWLLRKVQSVAVREAPGRMNTPPPTPVIRESPSASLLATTTLTSVRLPALWIPPPWLASPL